MAWKVNRGARIGVISGLRGLANRSWTVINARRSREKSNAIKRRYTQLTNYPPWIVIASLCQSLRPNPRVSPAAGFAFRQFVSRKRRSLFLTHISRSNSLQAVFRPSNHPRLLYVSRS